MSSGMNLFVGIGNLGKDPETRATPSGATVANFSIAINSSRKDKNTGERIEETEWVRCVAWNRTAEIVRDYLGKGAQVAIRGRLQTRKWQDKDGRDQYTTEVVVDDLKMLGKRGDNAAPAQQARSEAQPEGPFEDDIPFMSRHWQS